MNDQIRIGETVKVSRSGRTGKVVRIAKSRKGNTVYDIQEPWLLGRTRIMRYRRGQISRQ